MSAFESAASKLVRLATEAPIKIALVAPDYLRIERMVRAIVDIDSRVVVRQHPPRIRWPNGSEALAFTEAYPDRIRGCSFGAAWFDVYACEAEAEIRRHLMPALRVEPRMLLET